MTDRTDTASTAALLRRLAEVEDRVRALVAERRSQDPSPDDPFRGLYLSDDTVDRLLDRHLPPTTNTPSTSRAGRDDGTSGVSAQIPPTLRPLVAGGLDAVDLDLLLVAVLPDLDPRFERLYGYLNDDVTRRRASAGLALELCGL